MKKRLRSILYFLFSIFFLSGTVSAQDNPVAPPAKKDNTYVPSTHIRGGVIFGINAAQIDGDDYAGYHKVGLNFGFYGQIPVSKKFFVSTEILYSQKGAKNPVTPNTPLQFWYTWNIQYAEIPVLIHFQDKKAFNVGVGVSYARMVKEQLYASGEPQPPIDICTGKPPGNDLTDPKFLCLRKSDYEVIAEGNYLPIQHLAINVRYQYSPFPMGFYGSSNFINRSMHNNLLSFRLMFIFGK